MCFLPKIDLLQIYWPLSYRKATETEQIIRFVDVYTFLTSRYIRRFKTERQPKGRANMKTKYIHVT